MPPCGIWAFKRGLLMKHDFDFVRIALCGPGDVDAEIQIARDIITEWNVRHGEAHNLMVKHTHWKTDCYPELGDRPQSIVNHQMVDDSDAIIAIFWTRHGSPTGVASSGTEEEIRRGVLLGRTVHVYFSDIRPFPDDLDMEQFRRLIAFRTELSTNGGLCWSFVTREQFKADFERHLIKILNDLHRPKKRPRKPKAASCQGSRTISQIGNRNTAQIWDNVNVENLTLKVGKKSDIPPLPHPAGTIGANLDMHAYVEYLVKRFNKFRRASQRAFGEKVPFPHLAIHVDIENFFGCKTYFLPDTQFADVVQFLKDRIDNDTTAGRHNRKIGRRSYHTFEENKEEIRSKKYKKRNRQE